MCIQVTLTNALACRLQTDLVPFQWVYLAIAFFDDTFIFLQQSYYEGDVLEATLNSKESVID